ncbi:MAG: bifunctional ADP-heptose synthase [Chthoniobacterales bacterium]|nr:bifunctional ADP-heptose synthase [Chthoniobacterales bacterium]
MKKQRIEQILDAAASKVVVVLGDVMLDRFVYGKVTRISPEAPVPVVEVVRDASFPGGAANVARNLAGFCRDVEICGLVGKGCRHAEELCRLLEAEGVSTSLLLEHEDAMTIVKTRIIARQQQVVRVDRERRMNLPRETEEEALKKLEQAAAEADALIIEDYGKGLLSQGFVDKVIQIFGKWGRVITVDPNPNNPLNWRGVSAVKPNRLEAFAAAGQRLVEVIEDPRRDVALKRVGEILTSKWDVGCVLITLGEGGMMLFERGESPYYIPTRAKEVFDVSGAGDTAIALFTLALASGANRIEAAELANLASGIVVGKLGTATVTREELLNVAE